MKLLSPDALNALSNEELQRWYSVVNELTKRESVMNEIQSKVKDDLEGELKRRGILRKESTASVEQKT